MTGQLGVNPLQPPVTFDERLTSLRVQMKHIGAQIMIIKKEKGECEVNNTEDIGEIMANLTLSYRHIEDASMRIGKTIQARNAGVSIYDKNVVGSPE